MSNYETCACGAMMSNTGRVVVCEHCLRTLAANLAIGAGLCAAHMTGIDYAIAVESNVKRIREGRALLDMWFPGCGDPWRPGCARPAVAGEGE